MPEPVFSQLDSKLFQRTDVIISASCQVSTARWFPPLDLILLEHL